MKRWMRNRRRPRARLVALDRRVVARLLQRAGLDPPIEHIRGGQKLREERPLPVRRGRRFDVPAYVPAPAQRVDRLRRLVVPTGADQRAFRLCLLSPTG